MLVDGRGGRAGGRAGGRRAGPGERAPRLRLRYPQRPQRRRRLLAAPATLPGKGGVFHRSKRTPDNIETHRRVRNELIAQNISGRRADILDRMRFLKFEWPEYASQNAHRSGDSRDSREKKQLINDAKGLLHTFSDTEKPDVLKLMAVLQDQVDFNTELELRNQASKQSGGWLNPFREKVRPAFGKALQANLNEQTARRRQREMAARISARGRGSASNGYAVNVGLGTYQPGGG